MYLIQILLPLYDNNKQPFAQEDFDYVRDELAGSFGGITAFRRTPAEGVWREDDGDVSHDEVVIFEVMSEKLKRKWWLKYKKQLETRFRQEEIIIRATEVQKL